MKILIVGSETPSLHYYLDKHHLTMKDIVLVTEQEAIEQEVKQNNLLSSLPEVYVIRNIPPMPEITIKDLNKNPLDWLKNKKRKKR